MTTADDAEWGIDAIQFPKQNRKLLHLPAIRRGQRGPVLNLPKIHQVPFPLRPDAIANALLCLDPWEAATVLNCHPAELEIAVDFQVENSEALAQVIWELVMPENAERDGYLTAKYRETWYWRTVRPTYQPHLGLRPVFTGRADLRMYFTPNRPHILRLEEVLYQPDLCRLIALVAAKRLRVSCRQALHHIDLLTIAVNERFRPLFASGLLPVPRVVEPDDMLGLHRVLQSLRKRALRKNDLF